MGLQERAGEEHVKCAKNIIIIILHGDDRLGPKSTNFGVTIRY